MDCYIIGSGGFSKEVLRLLFDFDKNENFNFKGFIDYNPESAEVFADGKVYPVLDENDFLQSRSLNKAEIAVFIGIGEPKKNAVVQKKYQSFKFPNLIHPSFVGSTQSIILGEGNIITAGCVFTVDIKIGSFNIFNLNTTVGHDTEIGSFNVFNPGVNISGGVIVGDGILLGTNSTVLQYLKIGDNSVLGAGAVLTKDLDSNSLAVGVPAKVIKNI